MGDITANFSYSEFRPYGTAITWKPGNEMLQKKIDILAENLQVVRDNIGVSMTITSGVRTIADYKRLVQQGYNPSRTSDHYYGDPVPLSPGTPKYDKYGRMHYYSVGAVDIVPSMDVKECFDIVKGLVANGDCKFGQVIYEYNPKTQSEWLHLSNDPCQFFSEFICDCIDKRPFMQSLDNGKTYQIIK
jgi:hypothetical protein